MSERNVLGRKKETSFLKEILKSKEAEFLAIYGRRRVGKTFLIREYFSNKGVYLEITGENGAKLSSQLSNFASGFSKTFLSSAPLSAPKTWREGFELLTTQLKKVPKSKKIILFFDELPWLASRKSGLIEALDYFWNRYWSPLKNIILIVCGSAASWMQDHLINAKGGLHNRLTRTLLLRPYTLKSSAEFLRARGINFSIKQLCEIYMVCGGIPYYLKQLTRGKSATQNINRICFQKDGVLFNEFDRLFTSLFNSPEIHISIVKKLAEFPNGISKDDLTKKMKLSSGGRMNKRLDELEAAGFIQGFAPYGSKKKNRFYRLVDEYTIFYLHWIAPLKHRGLDLGNNYWQTKAKLPEVLTWMGLAFEALCFKHLEEIRSALGLEGIHAEVGAWRYVPKLGSKEEGAQVDLLFDRSDGIVTLCEIKYSNKLFVVDKEVAKKIKHLIETFEKRGPIKKKQVHFVLITPFGMKSTIWSDELIDDEIIFEELF